MEFLIKHSSILLVIIFLGFCSLQTINDSYNKGIKIRNKFVKVLLWVRPKEEFVAYVTIIFAVIWYIILIGYIVINLITHLYFKNLEMGVYVGSLIVVFMVAILTLKFTHDKLSKKEEKELNKSHRILSQSLARQMIEIYSESKNYIYTKGTIIDKIVSKDLDIVYKIRVDNYKNKDFFKKNKFFIVDSKYDSVLEIKDNITICFVDKIFYKKQIHPILYLKREDEVIYTENYGKQQYINWIIATKTINDNI